MRLALTNETVAELAGFTSRKDSEKAWVPCTVPHLGAYGGAQPDVCEEQSLY